MSAYDKFGEVHELAAHAWMKPSHLLVDRSDACRIRLVVAPMLLCISEFIYAPMHSSWRDSSPRGAGKAAHFE